MGRSSAIAAAGATDPGPEKDGAGLGGRRRGSGLDPSVSGAVRYWQTPASLSSSACSQCEASEAAAVAW